METVETIETRETRGTDGARVRDMAEDVRVGVEGPKGGVVREDYPRFHIREYFYFENIVYYYPLEVGKYHAYLAVCYFNIDNIQDLSSSKDLARKNKLNF